MTCQCKGIEDEFNERLARKELKSYRKRGPRRTTRILIESLREATESIDSLLDIGGGVGAIQHEFGKSGVTRITSVDASSAYLACAREEGDQTSAQSDRTYLLGDFLDHADVVQPADVVSLDRVLCCYDDVEGLVRRSAEKTVKAYGLVYPRSAWWSRLVFKAINATMKLRRSCFRVFVHSPVLVEDLLEANGFEAFSRSTGLLWQVVVYRRPI